MNATWLVSQFRKMIFVYYMIITSLMPFDQVIPGEWNVKKQ